MTRRLLAAGQKPVTVGTFFSLGHSTIVIITSIVVAATASAVSKKFNNFSHVGSIIGSSVSATFLLLLGIMNLFIGYKLLVHMRQLLGTPIGEEATDVEILSGGGPMFRILKKMFKLIDRPWKMYPLGVLFGLGFDTSSEIALLGISSIQSARGTSMWLILLFPLLFTAGMCMIDTADGALMMSLYSSASLAKDQIAICYYSLALTGITVIVAVFIGVVQFLILGAAVISDQEAKKPFWQGINALGDRYDVVGELLMHVLPEFEPDNIRWLHMCGIRCHWRRQLSAVQAVAEASRAAKSNACANSRATRRRRSTLSGSEFLERH
jgi:high-affinity nickel-transport protein